MGTVEMIFIGAVATWITIVLRTNWEEVRWLNYLANRFF